MKTNIDKIKAVDKTNAAGQDSVLANKKKGKPGPDLSITDKKIGYQNKIKETPAPNLIITDNAAAAQNKAVPRKKAGSSIAGEQLLYQQAKTDRLSVKLAVANEELRFQNIQKEKRAEELVIANQELLYQNEINDLHAAELKEALNDLESFSYSVSHDLRAPLRAISGLTQILAEDYVDQLDDEAKELMSEIISNSNKMGELIDNLLEFSRIGKQNISIGEVNINQLVAMVVTEQMGLDPTRMVKLDIKSMDHVQGDRNMLKQVFINLVSNAFKYTGKKDQPVIEIGSYRQHKNMVYYVKDNGAGFDMNYYDKLFGVFQRLHSNHEFDGTGVGLAIVQKIISKHCGKVWAEGELEQGACFYFSLPDPPVK